MLSAEMAKTAAYQAPSRRPMVLLRNRRQPPVIGGYSPAVSGAST